MSESDGLELKKRARRRLVGASALAVVAAIVLPMIMDDEPEVPLRDIQVSIPDRDSASQPIARQTLPRQPLVVPPMREPSEVDAVAEADPEPEMQADEAAIVDSDAPGDEGESELDRPEQSEPAPSENNETIAQSSSQDRDEAERVRSILEGRNTGGGAEDEPDRYRYAVQVGAFSDKTTAEGLGDDLEQQGYDSYIVPGERITRVRLGPYDSREKAESVAAVLQEQGIEGVVIQTR